MHSFPVKISKTAGSRVGTHQRLDYAARTLLGHYLPRQTYFPSAKEILYFEGLRGPDGLMRKSPGIDEPYHFLIPEDDDRRLITQILDCQYNLREALRSGNHERAAFEAAWMGHYITDGLTPAHHFPLTEVARELSVNDTTKSTIPIMRGETPLASARNNWLYYGAHGHMTTHFSFEYGIAMAVGPMRIRSMFPKRLSRTELRHVDLEREFYKSLDKITALDMYSRFKKNGWTAELALEVKRELLPEIVRMLTLAWASAIPTLNPTKESSKCA